jgi:hypothetical protein
MEAIVTNEATGQQTRQHLDLGGSELVPVPVYKGRESATPLVPIEQPAPLVGADLHNPVTDNSVAIRTARANRPDATISESVSAAIETWDTTGLLKRMARPTFTGEKINPVEYLDHVGMALSEDEREYFMSMGDTLQGANFAMIEIKNKREAYEKFGDHPAIASVTSILDPVWLGIPPAIRFGRLAGAAGRAASAAAAGGIAYGISAYKEGPISDEEVALNVLANAGAAALLFTPAGTIRKVDDAMPSERSQEIVQNMANKRTDVEGLAAPLQPGAVERSGMDKAIDDAIVADQKARGLGENLQWNQRKTMASYGEGGKKVANLFLDNNSDLSINSMESHRAAILTDLNAPKFAAEDKLMEVLGKRGYGWTNMVSSPRAMYQAQAEIEANVMKELYRREQLTRQGIDYRLQKVDQDISEIADRVGDFHKRALYEQQASGVLGAENIKVNDGFVHRVWSAKQLEDAITKLTNAGLERPKAVGKINKLVARSLKSANGWDDDLSKEIAQAITQRALAKGQFEDSLFNGLIDNSQLEQLRQVMRDGGMTKANIDKAINKIRWNQDDAGKVGHLKHRVDLDYNAVLSENGVNIALTDLLDNRLLDHMEKYSRSAATESAMARVGLKSQTEIDTLRKELMETTPFDKRQEASELFDNMVAYFKGQPSGARLNDAMRLTQVYGRSISLTWAGMWQLTDFATMWAKHGFMNVAKYAAKELPGFSNLSKEMREVPETARSLHNVLTEHSDANLRLRPFLHRFEDGHDLDMTSNRMLAGQGLGNLVSVANGLKFVHKKQANIAANLIIDRMDSAGRGNKAAREALSGYGLTPDVMERVSNEIKTHGYNVDKWDAAVWADTRPAIHKMMDELVLQSRAGDLPAFMMYDNLGKFLATYRNFTFTAHNKLLAGRLERDGSPAVAMMLLYQMPLSYLAVAAQSAIMGKDDTPEQIAAKAVGMLGGLGLLAEPMNWALGNSNEFGTPGTIPVDRAIKLGQDPSLTNLMNVTPLAAANPLWKALAQQYKEE